MGRAHLKANGCCRAISRWQESWRDRAAGPVDPADHDRVRDDAGPDRWDGLLSSHARPGRVAWPAGWVAALTPLSVDGMIVAASTTLLAESRSGSRGGLLPWVLLVIGSVASLAANVAVAEPTLTGRVIAAWPSFALIGSYELLMRQVRRAACRSVARGAASASRSSRQPAAEKRSVVTARRKTGARAGPDVRRQAWEWATANRAADGSLPSGKGIADRYGRHERWGRRVKSAGTGGEFTGPAAVNNHRQPGSDRSPRPAAG